ncbi:DNA polymerase subunit gamma-1, mitochondrial [Culicoides brevitarsis]|uniref:DNA polymerase subunit gamma-1, mitochondrial n=1 Tax=Culicoides brevitarsis TaxID=469753 RepID=UPI00307C0E2C
MRRFYSSKSRSFAEIVPRTTRKIFKKRPDNSKSVQEAKPPEVPKNQSTDYRENDFKIQMLSRNLHRQIFKTNDETLSMSDKKLFERFLSDLKRHELKLETSPRFKDVQLQLPELKGANIEEHFYKIGEMQSEPYKQLALSLVSKSAPEMPKNWIFQAGWVQYHPENGPQAVDFPPDDALVFDVEVCVNCGPAPVMAVAVSDKCWYSWVSNSLVNFTKTGEIAQEIPLDDYIPLESKQLTHKTPRMVIGHNVSYDRARVREQYYLHQSGLRFLDTMSLHVAVSGVTSYQRAMLKSKKEPSLDDFLWREQTSLNSLLEVYKLYCQKDLSKEARNIFMEGSYPDVVENFQDLMKYCASDVLATREVLTKLFPLFLERFPHPVTLAGMLEIGMAYLPVNENWKKYVDTANAIFDKMNIESKQLLARKAIDAVKLMKNEQYKKDLWLWDEDWSVRKPRSTKKKQDETKEETNIEPYNAKLLLEGLEKEILDDLKELDTTFHANFPKIKSKKPLYLPGFPAWYRKLCSKPDTETFITYGFPDKVTNSMQITPKLLNLCWEGYPLHYIKGYGWGFLVPFKDVHSEDSETKKIPIKELIKKCPIVDPRTFRGARPDELGNLWQDVEQKLSRKDYYAKAKKDQTGGRYNGTGIFSNIVLEGCCYFLKLPHKDGGKNNVGNPLSKDFITKFSENVLSGDGIVAERVMAIGRMLSYWRNNRDRIQNQNLQYLPNDVLPEDLKNQNLGAIIPQIVVCGTLTRRAMESTWLTASNAKEQRNGSELRAMIQSPPGYKIVGADVDSQELWIASVLGDAYAAQSHGATPFGWMTLSGTKSDATDMHSVTAKAIGINRDQAKIINYARIYGAGQQFAVQLLKQFNPTISDSEAKTKAFKMFQMTKGKRSYRVFPQYWDTVENKAYYQKEAVHIAGMFGKHVSEMFEPPKWEGGTESAMFNRLEEIANEPSPKTPFLGSRLSRALEPANGMEDRFLPTRINWVVQSGAVDFLHLMLVCMRWLMQDKIKFCLSFHDEVRYLVRDEHKYQAALAMHVTNLLTRAFCASKLGLKDLPQSVAFFSSVEIDKVLRKEATADCKTPSNPDGLEKGYGIPAGETLDIYQTLEKVGNGDISQWKWHQKT